MILKKCLTSKTSKIVVIKKIGIDGKQPQFITNLYWHRQANNNTHSLMALEFREEFDNDVYLTVLFNLYSEEIMAEVLEDVEEGIVINLKVIKYLRYADNTEAGLHRRSVKDTKLSTNSYCSRTLGLN